MKPLAFRDGEHTVCFRYDNRGDPFREGVEVEFERNDGISASVYVLLDRSEVERLRRKLDEFLESK